MPDGIVAPSAPIASDAPKILQTSVPDTLLLLLRATTSPAHQLSTRDSLSRSRPPVRSPVLHIRQFFQATSWSSPPKRQARTSRPRSNQPPARPRKNPSPLPVLRFPPINFFVSLRDRSSSLRRSLRARMEPPSLAGNSLQRVRRHRSAPAARIWPGSPAAPDYLLCDSNPVAAH